MGAAAYSRGSKHISKEIDRASKERQPALDRAAEYENTARRNEQLIVEIEQLRAKLAEAQNALDFEHAEHQRTIKRAEQSAESSYQAMSSLRRSYSEISEKLFSIRPLLKYEAMLLVCEDGGFVLVHPGAGGLASFASLDEAREWATRHDGFIKTRADQHDFHGTYHRVGFAKCHAH